MTYTINSTAYHAKYYERHADGTALELPPMGLLLHNGGGTVESDLHILTGNDPARKVGCNLYVTRTGIIYQLAPDTYQTWHAGVPDHATRRWWGSTAAAYGVVSGNRLIGVECEHHSKRDKDWPAAQLDALAWLFRQKIAAYGFPLQRLGGHKWYAPSRKTDPEHWPDPQLQAWLRRLYVAPGHMYEVTASAGARIRQGPGTSFPIAEAIPVAYRFWSDGVTVGQAVEGNSTWIHFAGPTPTIINPLGFIWSGIVREVAA